VSGALAASRWRSSNRHSVKRAASKKTSPKKAGCRPVGLKFTGPVAYTKKEVRKKLTISGFGGV